MKVEIAAKTENFKILNDICEKLLGEQAVKSNSYKFLMIAIEEIFVNISTYAYEGKAGNISFEIIYNNKGNVRVVFIDSGKPFNPLEFDSENNAKNNINMLTPGGLGIQLVKKITENLCYKYEKGKNILSFEKSLEEM